MLCDLQSPEEVDWSEFWDPKLSIENVIGEARTSVTCGISYDVNGRATVCQTRKVNGQFFEYMELNQFPFDSQVIVIVVKCLCGACRHHSRHMESNQLAIDSSWKFV